MTEHYLIAVRRTNNVVAEFIAAGPMSWHIAIGAWHRADEARIAAGTSTSKAGTALYHSEGMARAKMRDAHFKVRSEDDPEVVRLLAANDEPVLV